jgi:hypothetical protein
MVTEEVQARPQRLKHLVDLTLACIGPTAPGNGLNGFAASCVSRMSTMPSRVQASISSRTKCRLLSASSVARALPFFGCGSADAAVSYQVGAKVPPSPATRIESTVVAVPFGRYCKPFGRSPAANRIEIVVVAVDPVDRRAERLVAPFVCCDIPDAQPERHLGVPRDHVARGVEFAVDVSQGSEYHLVIW